jgi:phage tail sheath protein FI
MVMPGDVDKNGPTRPEADRAIGKLGEAVPEYLAPGVYVEEVSSRARPIEGVGTSTTGFVGTAPTGPRGRAVRIRSFAEFERSFGGLHPGYDMAYAVHLFFANRGTDAWIVGVPSDASPADGLRALDDVPGLALLCLPGQSDPGLLAAALEYAEERRAFLIVDPPGPDRDAAVSLARELARPGSANGAVYFPPVRVADPLKEGNERTCPPGGAVAGLYSRSDATRGVWKAPAGMEAVLLGVRGVEVALADDELGALNAAGVNGIRMLPGLGPVVWGARTIQGADQVASEWKYVPVRRLTLYIEESLRQGTQWVVFEPNDEPLWASIRLAALAFLDGLFRAGAFQGRAPEEAYFVRCDRSTMTQDDIDHGVLILVVGIAPLKPAEFVIIRIEQLAARAWTGRLDEAIAYAIEAHQGQMRKGTEIPYVSHLLGVCSLVIEDGGNETEAIAAMLHDAAEDQGGRQRLEDIRVRFGDRVSEIVEGCTDTFEDPKPSWRARKEAYVAHVRASRDEGALRVSLADKLHNARAILRDYRRLGDGLWERFNAGAEEILWYYRALGDAFRSVSESPMVEELAAVVAQLESSGALRQPRGAGRRPRPR